MHEIKNSHLEIISPNCCKGQPDVFFLQSRSFQSAFFHTFNFREQQKQSEHISFLKMEISTSHYSKAPGRPKQTQNRLSWPINKRQLYQYISLGSLFTIHSFIHDTLGGIASICFKFPFQTDYQQTLRTHTQGCQGCQKIRNFVRNTKILIARSTIQPKLNKIKKTVRNASKFIKKW